MVECMETEVGWAPAQEATSRAVETKNVSRRDKDPRRAPSDGKFWNRAPSFALIATIVFLVGLGWVYYDAVLAVETALSVFKLY